MPPPPPPPTSPPSLLLLLPQPPPRIVLWMFFMLELLGGTHADMLDENNVNYAENVKVCKRQDSNWENLRKHDIIFPIQKCGVTSF
jgi:hypothetical protein